MNEPLTQLHAEAMTAEREWTVEEIPVLSAGTSSSSGQSLPPHPAVLPAPVPFLPTLL